MTDNRLRYQVYGAACLAELLGDFVIYRNLTPVDRRLPGIEALRAEVGIPAGSVPRKSEPVYARVVVELLRRARCLEGRPSTLRRLIYIGDTRMNDGAAFGNLCAAGGWDGWAFIGAEQLAVPAHSEIAGRLYLANKWAALRDFAAFLEAQAFQVDAATVVVLDIDKTCIGARGRNDGAIDAARIAGLEHTVAELRDTGFDAAAFRRAYATLNQPQYHPFTGDNQDYLAYLCLMIGGGVYALDPLLARIASGALRQWGECIAEVAQNRVALAGSGLAAIHAAVWERVQAGDPTPFKAFRRNEYLCTAACFGMPGDSTDVQTLLAQHIVITHEIWEFATACKARGALVFGLSDKPDEAALPDVRQAVQGQLPLHRLQTALVGSVQ